MDGHNQIIGNGRHAESPSSHLQCTPLLQQFAEACNFQPEAVLRRPLDQKLIRSSQCHGAAAEKGDHQVFRPTQSERAAATPAFRTGTLVLKSRDQVAIQSHGKHGAFAGSQLTTSAEVGKKRHLRDIRHALQVHDSSGNCLRDDLALRRPNDFSVHLVEQHHPRSQLSQQVDAPDFHEIQQNRSIEYDRCWVAFHAETVSLFRSYGFRQIQRRVVIETQQAANFQQPVSRDYLPAPRFEREWQNLPFQLMVFVVLCWRHTLLFL